MFSKRNEHIQDYIHQLFVKEDETLAFVRSHAKELGIPDIHVPTNVGKLLYLIAKTQKCHKILEVGTLIGYSTIWLARALEPQGKLISLEIDPKRAQIAQEHLKRAGLNHCVEIRQGNALELLPEMIQRHEGPFDLIFIDADKTNNQAYLIRALQLSRPGSLILVDNLMPKGDHIGTPSNHEGVSIYQFNDYLARHPKLETTLIPTVVHQGRVDCLGLARVKDSI